MANKTRRKSPFATIERLSPNRNKPRNSPVRGSIPHHAAGNISVEALLSLPNVVTYDPKKGMSMGDAIGNDGRMGLCVEETNRSWTSSSIINDHRCITSELSNNSGAPDWRIGEKTINTWLDATVERCRFYGFSKVNYQPKPANITPVQVNAWIDTWAKDDEWIILLHNWFANTICPGPYFERQLPWLVREMNKRLQDPDWKPEAFVGEGNTATGQTIPVPETPIAPVTTPTLKSIDVIAKEVLAGTWGNGQDRITRLTTAGYDSTAVQAEVNRLTAVPAKVSTPPAFKEYGVIVAVSALNIRKGPSVKEPIVRTLINDKKVYTITEERVGPSGGGGATGNWGKLKSGAGWILLEFTKRK